MTPQQFRIVLALSFGLGLLGAGADLTLPLLPESFQQAQEAHDAQLSNTTVFIGAAIGIGLLAAGLASFVGLFRFRPWARKLAVVSTLASLVFIPLLGATAQSGLAASLGEASAILWGIAIALAYWSPLAEHFSRSDA